MAIVDKLPSAVDLNEIWILGEEVFSLEEDGIAGSVIVNGIYTFLADETIKTNNVDGTVARSGLPGSLVIGELLRVRRPITSILRYLDVTDGTTVHWFINGVEVDPAVQLKIDNLADAVLAAEGETL